MTDLVRVISCYLGAPEGHIRCAAAQALGALDDEDAAPALVDALLDADPDVRADAMAALARCARPQDAAALRRSLQDDPVGEVKTAAVRALGRLGDDASAALLRALARDRCEPEVAWEQGGWDDWLDVQVAAIAALGGMCEEAAVDDLIRARDDETGQDLDHVVFAALAKMPGRGVAALLDAVKDGNARVRQRALAALSRAGPERLAALRGRLVDDPSPAVRRIAADCLDAGDAALGTLALEDPDASVRAAALSRIAPVRPDIGLLALSDPDTGVRAAALEMLAAHTNLAGEPGLAAKLEAWLHGPDAHLAAVCAAVLPKVMGSAAASTLRETAADKEKLTEVRVAALQSLGAIDAVDAVDGLRAAAVDTVRQVRLAALAAAGALTRTASVDVRRRARDVLIDAVRGGLQTMEAARGTDGNDDVPGDAAARSGERGRIATTPEGGVVPVPPEALAARPGGDTQGRTYPRSTLEAIQATGLPTAAPSRDPSPSSPPGGRVRFRRVPVEGTADVDDDIRLLAVRLMADCAADGIDESLAEAAECGVADIRAGAIEAIAQRAAAMPLSPALQAVLVRSLEADDARARCAAARGLAHSDATPRLVALLDDADASVRAAAVTAVAAVQPGRVMAGFRDPSPLVRRSALDATIASGEDRFLEDGLRMLVDGDRADSLMDACRRHVEVRRGLTGMLSASELSTPRLRMILEALAAPPTMIDRTRSPGRRTEEEGAPGTPSATATTAPMKK